MSVIDVETFLKPISADAPCGEDLSADREYAGLEQVVAGTPERQIGETIVPAQDPDWKQLHKSCTQLLGRSRDLRLMVYLTLAALRLEGVPGLRDGLAVLRKTVEQHWEALYPRLDPDDNLDPLERMNILQCLCSPGGYGDPVMFDRRLREAPLCRSRQFGAVSLRDVAVAKGELKLPPGAEGDRKPPELAAIEAAFKDTPTEELQATSAALADAVGHVKALDALLGEKAGEERKVDLAPLVKTLTEMQAPISKALEKRGAASAAALAAAGHDGNGAAAQDGGPVGGRFAVGVGSAERQGIAMDGSTSEIRTQDDVIAVLDAVGRYYERYEPSSPVPLMLKATRRLIGKNFAEIMKILTPELFGQIATIASEAEASS
jgi:type VI secretion system protein ImpA